MFFNNAGKNVILAVNCNRKGLKNDFKFTASRSPQHNSVAERDFTTLSRRTTIIMNKTKCFESLRKDWYYNSDSMQRCGLVEQVVWQLQEFTHFSHTLLKKKLNQFWRW